MKEKERQRKREAQSQSGVEIDFMTVGPSSPEWGSFCGASVPPFGEMCQSSQCRSPPCIQHTSTTQRYKVLLVSVCVCVYEIGIRGSY